MRETPLPSGFEWLAGRVHFVHRATSTEYASSCPECGGEIHQDGEWPDRFRMFVVGKPRAWCRRCGIVLFPDMLDKGWKPDPQVMRQWQEERERAAMEARRKAEHQLALLEQERVWVAYHDAMDAAARERWTEAGVPESWQDFWQLGYARERRFEHEGEFFTRAALSIPKFDFGWQPKNIDFRLIDPPEGAGKYRPLANIPPAAYITTPHERCFRDEVFVVEGSKKAMVTALYTGKHLKQVIGLPSCTSWAGMEKKLSACGRVWVIFDPDATDWAMRFAREVGANARVVELAHKPDDAITKYGMTPNMFEQCLRQAVKVV